MTKQPNASSQATSPRKRPKPGERRAQILQALASMLQEPQAERITTAALAARVQVSEAALYRHFSSKAQMYEALLDFIEQTVLGLVQQIAGDDAVLGTLSAEEGRARAAKIVQVLLQFAEKNPGMVRVMVGDALQGEHARLQARVNLFLDKVESTLRQCLRPTGEDAAAVASVLLSFVQGRWLRFVRTGFKRAPAEHGDASLAVLLAALA